VHLGTFVLPNWKKTSKLKNVHANLEFCASTTTESSKRKSPSLVTSNHVLVWKWPHI